MSLLNGISRLLGGADDRLRHQEDLLTTLLVMAWMVEARDPYTGGHLWRVSRFSRLLAADAGLPDADVARISIGGFLHDLGKISIPDHILGKKDRLAMPTGRMGAPQDLEPEADTALIASVVRESARALLA